MSQSGTESQESMLSDEFVVEKILSQRFYEGKMQYLIRWQGYKPEDDTWEPEENIRDRRIIDDWEKKNAADEATKSTSRGKKGKVSSSFAAATKKGFARGLVPERILGASRIVDENGKRSGEEKLYYIIKWINSEQADIVTAEEAKQKCPYLVFKFYEERILPEQETAEERIQSAMEPRNKMPLDQ